MNQRPFRHSASERCRVFVTSAFALALAWLAPGTTEAANHYVRAGATGSQNGSNWLDATAVLPETLIRGDTYYLAAGIYPSRTLSTPVAGTATITIKRATTSDHGTDSGWVDAYADGPAIFNGMIELTSSYWVIDGATGGGAENRWSEDFGFEIVELHDERALIRVAYSGTANHIALRHVDLQGKGSASDSGGYYSNDGLAIYGAQDVVLSHYHMRGIGRCPFFISTRDSLFEHGWVESYFGSSAVHSEIASTWSITGDVTFRYNLFTDIQLTGGLMWDNSATPSAHLFVYGNVFYKPPGAVWGEANGLIGGWTGANGEECRNIWVYNNTFVNVDQQTLSTFPRIASGNVAYNNLFYNCQSPDFSKFDTHDYNHFISSGGVHGEPHGTSASGGDPFENSVERDFRLRSATTAGLPQPPPFDHDALGKVRGGDGLWDRGAYEFGSGHRLAPPRNLQVR